MCEDSKKLGTRRNYDRTVMEYYYRANQRRFEEKPHGHLPNDSESDDEQLCLGF